MLKTLNLTISTYQLYILGYEINKVLTIIKNIFKIFTKEIPSSLPPLPHSTDYTMICSCHFYTFVTTKV